VVTVASGCGKSTRITSGWTGHFRRTHPATESQRAQPRRRVSGAAALPWRDVLTKCQVRGPPNDAVCGRPDARSERDLAAIGSYRRTPSPWPPTLSGGQRANGFRCA